MMSAMGANHIRCGNLLPPPLRGRVGVGGGFEPVRLRPPPPTPPRKGEGRANAVLASGFELLT